MASVGAPSLADRTGAWVLDAGVLGAGVLGALGAEVLGAEVLGGGALGTVVVGGGCDGFGEFGRGNGCGVCAAAVAANTKLNTETRRH